MMAAFTPNPAELKKLCASPGMITTLDRYAQRIVNYAELTGPYVTGNYSRSWRIYSGTRNGIAWCRIENVAHYSGFLEFGTRHMKRQRILGRAISASRR
jgi:hypothetical protein